MSNTNAQSHPGSPADLAQPLYGASFDQAIKRFFKKYATFSGRASRSEFWWVYLMNSVIGLVLATWMFIALASAIDPVSGDLTGSPALFIVPVILLMVYGLAVFVPQLALYVRRLHDGGFSAWFILLGFIPGVGGLILLVFALMPSKPEGAQFDAGAARQEQYVPYPQA